MGTGQGHDPRVDGFGPLENTESPPDDEHEPDDKGGIHKALDGCHENGRQPLRLAIDVAKRVGVNYFPALNRGGAILRAGYQPGYSGHQGQDRQQDEVGVGCLESALGHLSKLLYCYRGLERATLPLCLAVPSAA
ncbi:hypothetical protein ES703_20430 [subsurface metagenome]